LVEVNDDKREEGVNVHPMANIILAAMGKPQGKITVLE